MERTKPAYELGAGDFIPIRGLLGYSKRTEITPENSEPSRDGKIVDRETLLLAYNCGVVLAAGFGLINGLSWILKNFD